MTMKSILLSATFVALNTLSVYAFASDKSIQLETAVETQQPSHREVAKKFSAGESFTQGGVTYTVYPELIANFNKDRKEDSNKNGISPKELVSTKEFKIYNIPLSEDKNSKDKRNQVVLNDSTNTFGILSGVIIVKMKGSAKFPDSSFELVKTYPALGYYLVRLPKTGKIKETIAKIKREKNVEDVSVEVLENFKEPL